MLGDTRRDGQTIYYSIASTPAQQLLESLFSIYCAPVRNAVPSPKPLAPATRA